MANKTLEYRDGAVTLKGYLADDGRPGARPGVVLFPEATGVGDHVIEKTRRLASLGYVALAADPYGEGRQAKDLPEAIELMTAVRSDVGRWRARAQAALDALYAQPGVDRTKVAAIGYCFGGSTALELGRSGAPLSAVVSFHGGLAAPKPEDARNIRAKVLVCHAAEDTLVPPEQVAAFEAQMRETKVAGRSASTAARCTASRIRMPTSSGTARSATTRPPTGAPGPRCSRCSRRPSAKELPDDPLAAGSRPRATLPWQLNVWLDR